MTSPITPQDAAHVLWHFGYAAIRPGSGIAALIDTATRFDPSNRARLRASFPGIVDAVNLAMGDDTGVPRLQAIAGPYVQDTARDGAINDLADEVFNLSQRIDASPLPGVTKADVLVHLADVNAHLSIAAREATSGQ